MLFLRAAFPLVSVTAVLLVARTVDGPPAQSPRSPPPPPPRPAHHRHHHLYYHGRHCRHHHDGQDTSLLLYVWLCRLLRALTGHKGMNTASPSEPHSSPDSVTRAIVSGRLSCCPPQPPPPPSAWWRRRRRNQESNLWVCLCSDAPSEVTPSFSLLVPCYRHSLWSVLPEIKYNLEYYITFKKKKREEEGKMTP